MEESSAAAADYVDGEQRLSRQPSADAALSLWQRWRSERSVLSSLRWAELPLLRRLLQCALSSLGGRGEQQTEEERLLSGMLEPSFSQWDSRLSAAEVALPSSYLRWWLQWERELSSVGRAVSSTRTDIEERLRAFRSSLRDVDAEEPSLQLLKKEREVVERLKALCRYIACHKSALLWLVSSVVQQQAEAAALLAQLVRQPFWSFSPDPLLKELADTLMQTRFALIVAKASRKKNSSSAAHSRKRSKSEPIRRYSLWVPAHREGELKATLLGELEPHILVTTNDTKQPTVFHTHLKNTVYFDNPKAQFPCARKVQRATIAAADWADADTAFGSVTRSRSSTFDGISPSQAWGVNHNNNTNNGNSANNSQGASPSLAVDESQRPFDRSPVVSKKDSLLLLKWSGPGYPRQVEFVALRGADKKKRVAISVDALQRVLDGRKPESYQVSNKKNMAHHQQNIKEQKLVPVVRVSFKRSVFDGRDVSVTWDSRVCVSSCYQEETPHTAPSILKRPKHFSLLPYHVVRVSCTEQVANSKWFKKLMAHEAWISAPDFSEFLTGVSLYHDETLQPAWMSHLQHAWASDWSAAFQDRKALYSSQMRSAERDALSLVGRKESGRSAWRRSGSFAGAHMEEDMEEEQAVPEDFASLDAIPLLSPASAVFDVVNEQEVVEQRKTERQMRSAAQRDPKVYWANERTLLSWLSNAIFLAISSVSLLTFGDRLPQIAGLIIAPVGMVIAVYSLLRFQVRLNAVMAGGAMRSVIDRVGPWVMVPLICLTLSLLLAFSFVFGPT